MAQNVRPEVSGKAKNTKSMYARYQDKAKKALIGYVGDPSGKARRFWPAVYPVGSKWEMRDMPFNKGLNDLIYTNQFVGLSILGSAGNIVTSPDGWSWTERGAADDGDWRKMTYGKGTYVASAYSRTNNMVKTSPDAINWTYYNGSGIFYVLGLCFGNDFVSVGSQGNQPKISSSPDGKSWTARTAPADYALNAVKFGKGSYIAVSGGITAGSRVLSSPDTISWTSRPSPDDAYWSGLDFGLNMFLAFSGGMYSPLSTAVTMFSPDGISGWTKETAIGYAWSCICNGAGMFASSAANQCNQINTSPDGHSWTRVFSTGANVYPGLMAYGAEKFVCWVTTSSTYKVVCSL